MTPKELHDFLFHLYDYADYLAEQITPNNPDNNAYLASLGYIEDMMDIYGRGLIRQSAEQGGLDSSASLTEAHRRIDLLRKRMSYLRKTYSFDDAIGQAEKRLSRNWTSSQA